MIAQETKAPWTCATCQASNDPDFTRCRLCGQPQPGTTPPVTSCKSCGHSILSKDACCPACGSKEFLQL